MSDPVRWRDGGGPCEARELLTRAPRPRPMNPAERTHHGKWIARLALLPAAASVAALWVKVVVAAVGVSVASVAVVHKAAPEWLDDVVETVKHPGARKTKTKPSGPSHTLTVPQTVQSSSPVVLSPDDQRPEPATPPEPTATGSAYAAPPRATPAPRRITVPSAERPSHDNTSTLGNSLQDEARLLDNARRLLESNPQLALRLLEQSTTRANGSGLGEEREFLMIQALYRVGRAGESLHRATHYVHRNPYGFYAERLTRQFRIERIHDADGAETKDE